MRTAWDVFVLVSLLAFGSLLLALPINALLYVMAGDASGWAQPSWTMPVSWAVSAVILTWAAFSASKNQNR